MLSNKSLALALCLTITGCAQNPQNDASGEHWWSFGSDKAAAKDVTAKADAKAGKAAVKADAKVAKEKVEANADKAIAATKTAEAKAKADAEVKAAAAK